MLCFFSEHIIITNIEINTKVIKNKKHCSEETAYMQIDETTVLSTPQIVQR